MKIKQALLVLFITLAILVSTFSVSLAVPPLPSSFYGTVKYNSANVPLDTVVSVRINGVQHAATTLQIYNNDTVYSLDVPGDDPSTTTVIEGGVSGDTVVFYINGFEADQTAPWVGGTNTSFNLTSNGNHPPSAADNTVFTLKNNDKVFTATDFKFYDVDPGDALSQVQITTLETDGELYLDGNSNGSVDGGESVTLNQVIPNADIPKMKFKPETGMTGSPYTTFGFKVHDGEVYSSDAYEMTINVTSGMIYIPLVFRN